MLCRHGKAHYKNAFQNFAYIELRLQVRWEKQLTHGTKHLLLCDVVSRLPEDEQTVLDELGLKGTTNTTQQVYKPRILNLIFEHSPWYIYFFFFENSKE